MPHRMSIAAQLLLALLIAGCSSSPFAPPEPPRPGAGAPPTPAPAAVRASTPDTTQPPVTIARPTATPPPTVPQLAATLTSVGALNRTRVSTTPGTQVEVFVPAALGPLFVDLTAGYMGASPAAGGLQLSMGSMVTLIEHIRAGGAIDVLVADDATTMQVAQTANLIAGPSRVFARSRLNLITPAANPKNIAALKDLANPGTRWLVGTDDTPLGSATARALDRAASLPEYGPTFRTQAEGNIQIRLKRVDDLLDRLADGQGDAAVVYSADLTPDMRRKFQVIELPEATNELVDYSIAVLRGPNAAGAETFVSYLQSAAARSVFTAHGLVENAPLADATVDQAASATFSPTFDLGGLVAAPRRFTRADLAALPQETLQVTHATDAGPRTESFTGTRLLNVFNAAGGARLPADVLDAKLRVSIRVIGADDSEVTLGWGMLDPDFGDVPVMVAIERDGEALEEPLGMAQLVVPGDRLEGRSIRAIKRIELVDPGPPPAP